MAVEKMLLKVAIRFFTSHRIKEYTVYITEIYMKTRIHSSIIKNHKNYKKRCFDGVPFKGYVASEVIFRFGTRNKKMHCGNIQ